VRKVLPQILLLSISLLMMTLLGEAVLRLALGPPVIWRHPQEHYQPDPELGHRLVADQSAFTHDKLFETNSQGIRSPELPRRPPSGTRRLLALGDSQTAGDGLVLADTWPDQLARQLEGRDPGSRWEVLNGGLSGSSPWQYAILLERLAGYYEFEGVVIGLYVNDVNPRPQQVAPGVLTNTFARRVGYVLKRSALFTAIWRARQPLRAALFPNPGTGRETRILTGEEDPLLERGWRDLEVDLRDIRDFPRASEMGVWLLVLPRRDQVDGSELGRAYNERSRAIADGLGIPVIDVLEPLQAEYAELGRALFIPWDGHNATSANRVVARELAEQIVSKP